MGFWILVHVQSVQRSRPVNSRYLFIGDVLKKKGETEVGGRQRCNDEMGEKKVSGSKREGELEWKLKGWRPINLSTRSGSRPSLKTFYFLSSPLLSVLHLPFSVSLTQYPHHYVQSPLLSICLMHSCSLFYVSTNLLSLYLNGLCVWERNCSLSEWTALCMCL